MSFYKDRPTQKQLDFLERLGHKGDAPASKGDASDLIEALLEAEKRTKLGCWQTIRNAVLLAFGVFCLFVYCAIRDSGDPEGRAAFPAAAPSPSTLLPDTEVTSASEATDTGLDTEPVALPPMEAVPNPEPVALPSIVADDLSAVTSPIPDTSGDESRAPQETPSPQFRTWTDSTGKFSVEAVWIGTDGNGVTLEKRDGKTVTLPIDRLSNADQEWIQGAH
jgi:hypothetical protein